MTAVQLPNPPISPAACTGSRLNMRVRGGSVVDLPLFGGNCISRGAEKLSKASLTLSPIKPCPEPQSIACQSDNGAVALCPTSPFVCH